MSLGRFVVDVVKALQKKQIEIIDIPKVSNDEAILVIPDGSMMCRVGSKKDYFNIEMHKDKFYVGVEDCSREGLETIIDFLLERFEKATTVKKSK